MTDIEQLLLANLRIAKKQIIRLPCFICGEQNAVMHHIKHVRKALQKKQNDSLEDMADVMADDLDLEETKFDAEQDQARIDSRDENIDDNDFCCNPCCRRIKENG